MPFSDDRDDIAIFRMGQAVLNRFAAIRDFNVFAVGFCKSDLDICQNIFHFLKAGIIRRDDRQICQLSANLSHRVPAIARPVAAASEDADETLRLVVAQRQKKTFHADRIVGVVNDHGALC